MTVTEASIAALRRFSRAFTQRSGLLSDKPYDPSLSLMESRLVFELAQTPSARAADLARTLGVDKGYLSRALAGLRRRRLVTERQSASDAREKRLSLTPRGRKLFARIDGVSRRRARALLESAGEELATRLTEAELRLLPPGSPGGLRAGEVELRDLEPGDLGWLIGRHGELYWRERGWNQQFEILVGEIAVAFAKGRDARRERAWIAHARGLRLGCVLLVRQDERTAKLRVLLVDPLARGLGLGGRLVAECIRFAKGAGYRRLVLWTNSELVSARRIYEAAGFTLEREEAHESFGRKLVGQYWAKTL